MECIQNDKSTENLWNFNINMKIKVAKCQIEKIAIVNKLQSILDIKKIIYYYTYYGNCVIKFLYYMK